MNTFVNDLCQKVPFHIVNAEYCWQTAGRQKVIIWILSNRREPKNFLGRSETLDKTISANCLRYGERALDGTDWSVKWSDDLFQTINGLIRIAVNILHRAR